MTIKPLTVESNITKDIYKQCKRTCGQLTNEVKSRMNPIIRKYIDSCEMFVQGYEAGLITDWRQFFMTADEMRNSYQEKAEKEFNKEKELFKK